jgi:hypothetical protein
MTVCGDGSPRVSTSRLAWRRPSRAVKIGRVAVAALVLTLTMRFPDETMAQDADWAVLPSAKQVVLDIDGDGWLDSVTLGDGALWVRVGATAHVLWRAASHAAATDYDCDGRMDLLLDGGPAWVPNEVLRGLRPDGPDGNHTDRLSFSPLWDSSGTYMEIPSRHIIADFDGDGRNELITADYNGPLGADVATLRIFESDDRGEWTQVWSYAAGPRIFSGMAVADTDGDGKIELIAGKIGGSYLGGPYVGPRVYIFESDGDNSLKLDHLIEVDPSPTSAAFSFLDDLAVGDMNADGKPEIAVGLSDNETLFTSNWGSRVRLYSWNGPFSQYDLKFNHTQTSTGVGYLTAIDIGDSDDDGALEIVWFNRVIPVVHRAAYVSGVMTVSQANTGVPAGVCLDVNVVDCDDVPGNELLLGTSTGANGHIHILRANSPDTFDVQFVDAAGIGNTVLYVDTDSHSPPFIAGASHSGHALVLRYDPAAQTYATEGFFVVAGAPQLHEVTIGAFDQRCTTEIMLTRLSGGPSGSGVYEERIPLVCPSCPPDLSGDGRIDQADLGILLADYGCAGRIPVRPCPGDIDQDGATGQADLGLLLAAYGSVCP